MKYENLLDGKTVNVKALKEALDKEVGKHSFYESKSDLSNYVDNFIQLNIEIPAFENLVEEKGEEATNCIEDIIDNADDLRDCQNDYINELAEKLDL